MALNFYFDYKTVSVWCSVGNYDRVFKPKSTIYVSLTLGQFQQVSLKIVSRTSRCIAWDNLLIFLQNFIVLSPWPCLFDYIFTGLPKFFKSCSETDLELLHYARSALFIINDNIHLIHGFSLVLTFILGEKQNKTTLLLCWITLFEQVEGSNMDFSKLGINTES